ncbi:MAG: hypothetical protein S4CHLAM123_05110 [Chlamydiales bacterium]|nr:hypothetical protein [Chlamydiales bacterium]
MCTRNIFLVLLLLPSLLSASPESAARRLQAHLLIGDTKSAVIEAKHALHLYPSSPLIHGYLIKSLAAGGEDAEMMAAWDVFHAFFEKESMEQELLESMCWGILKKGKTASATSSQLISVIGSALTQDMRALPFILDGLRHTNAHIRLASVELAALYGDQPLKDELCRLFFEESSLEVRLKVIKALGKLKLENYLPHLMQIVASPKAGARETLAAIEAIVNMRECVEKEELEVLLKSPRSGLRTLGCEVIAHCELTEFSYLLEPLLADSQPAVQAAALKTWGVLKVPLNSRIRRLSCNSLDSVVGVTASWVWLINDCEEGKLAMLKWLKHDQPHVRALAASAVAAAGRYGTELAVQFLPQTKDPYVRVNLALALIGQRESCVEACEILENALMHNSERWMISEQGFFQTLEKSTLRHNPTIPNYPEVMNQTVRLEMLNLLAILDSPGALDSITAFLQQKKWGVTGLAAEMLLGEGDESAFELVRALLNDPNQELRLEAALILASWGKDPLALPTLLEEYPRSDRQTQVKILESLSRIGDRKALPFLIERLKEPSLMLRMIASSVLIQTLNH